MASKAQVALHGRFKPGTQLRLVKVKDETVLRSEGSEEVATGTVDADGRVVFDAELGACYLICGLVDGFPLEVRAKGKPAGDDEAGAFVRPDRGKLTDGTFVDERPEKVDAPFGGVGPGPGIHQVPDGVVLRSDTGRGSGHPVDPEEQAPYPPQSEYADEEQRSSTERGQAVPIAHGTGLSQEDIKDGTLQRSDTPKGVATPIPEGDAVQAQEARESAHTKAAIGDPGKAAAAPVDHAVSKKAAKQAAKSNDKNDKE